MITIHTSDGDVLIDDEDYHIIKDRKIKILITNKKKRTPYKCVAFWDARISTRKYIVLARHLLNAPDGMEVDHINRNSLDNRRENLRLVTRTQNVVNRTARLDANEWGYRGIVRYKASKKHPSAPDNYYWRASVGSGSSKIHAGSSKNPHVSALKYNKVAKETYGEFVLLNEVECFSERNQPRETKCQTCNAGCFCCCVCL